MRKLSRKWPIRLTIFSFLPPIFYFGFRIGNPDIFNSTDFAQRLLGGSLVSIIVWATYGIACLFARNWVNCEKCKFSDGVQGSKEMKCRLTGYTYPMTYSCKKSIPKGDNSIQTNSISVKSDSQSIGKYIENELDKKVTNKISDIKYLPIIKSEKMFEGKGSSEKELDTEKMDSRNDIEIKNKRQSALIQLKQLNWSRGIFRCIIVLWVMYTIALICVAFDESAGGYDKWLFDFILFAKIIFVSQMIFWGIYVTFRWLIIYVLKWTLKGFVE